MATTAPPERVNTVRSLIESDNFKSSIARILPTHLTPERFVRIAIASTTRVPKLAECDPNTVLQCLITLSQFGLEPDGRNAHLIPFWNSQARKYDCQLIIDYKGLAALAKRSGQVSYVHSDSVCDNDAFEYNKGVVVKHEVNFKESRGKPYCYYAMVRFKDGTEQADCMTKAEVDRIRARSRAKDNGPWVTDYDEMAKKTVFRRLSKWLELSPEFRDALDADADKIEELRFETALPIQRAKVRTLKDREPSQQDSKDGSDKTSGPAVGLGDSTPTAPSNDVASAVPSKRKLRKKDEPKPAEAPAVGKHEQQMTMRLASLQRSPDQLVQVAKQFDALAADGTWNDIGESGFEELLFPDNWKLIEAELKNL